MQLRLWLYPLLVLLSGTNLSVKSISPCVDFQRHLCDGNVWTLLTSPSFEELTKDVPPIDWNDPIMDDAYKNLQKGDPPFNATVYKSKVEERCGNCLHCYVKEFKYFYNLYNWALINYPSYKGPNDSRLVYLSEVEQFTHDEIPKLISAVSGMIPYMQDKYSDLWFMHMFGKIHYQTLSEHVTGMLLAQEAKLEQKTATKRLHLLVEELKAEIKEIFKETDWLLETNEFGLDHQFWMENQLNEIEVAFDFDDLDSALKYWKRLHRTMVSKYYEYSARTTGYPHFDVSVALHTVNLELENSEKTPEELVLYRRVFDWGSVVYNTEIDYENIIIRARQFYPRLSENSTDTAVYAFGAELASQLLKGFTKKSLAVNDDNFKRSMTCYTRHHSESCNGTFKECSAGGTCENCTGRHEPPRDYAPQIEGVRAAFRLMKKKYNEQQLKDLERPPLNVTRAQAFFYEYGLTHCWETNNFLNSVVAQLDEFSDAFGCKAGDVQYTKPGKRCHLLGKQAGTREKNTTNRK